ncbi:MAG: FKBP-type peptidyl-prolyl cis-trans isomerase [Bacteroidetes bacterium]|nr:FKBP-type peptidyl-prolyl cis-trans isomerase [Bacteroidota bacterium]
MQITEDKVVSVSYNLTASKDNGPEELIEQTTTDRPFAFLFGYGGVLPDFETNLASKQKGDKFDFKVTAKNGYGSFEKDYLVKVDKTAFMVDGKFDDARVIVGEDIEMNDAEGNQLVGRVLQITDSFVEMDFNHPLAGYDLHFIGEVLDIRNASKEELEHGHVHGPGGHHH